MIKLDIVNDGTSERGEVGHYDAYLYLPVDGRYVEHHVRVEEFDRSLGWEALVRQAVDVLARAADHAKVAG